MTCLLKILQIFVSWSSMRLSTTMPRLTTKMSWLSMALNLIMNMTNRAVNFRTMVAWSMNFFWTMLGLFMVFRTMYWLMMFWTMVCVIYRAVRLSCMGFWWTVIIIITTMNCLMIDWEMYNRLMSTVCMVLLTQTVCAVLVAKVEAQFIVPRSILLLKLWALAQRHLDNND